MVNVNVGAERGVDVAASRLAMIRQIAARRVSVNVGLEGEEWDQRDLFSLTAADLDTAILAHPIQ